MINMLDTAKIGLYLRAAGAALMLGLAAAEPARATEYQLAKDASPVIGEDQTYTTVYEDTLYDLARKYSLGSEELIRVNPFVDPWIPGAGKQIVIPGRHILPPGPREGIVVNLPEHRLYYYPKPRRDGSRAVITYPVSIGKMDWRTPLGLTQVIQKIKDPVWYPPESVRKEHAAAGDILPASVPAGPDNPLGAFAMRLAAGKGTYLIHGTNNPIAVGLAVTHGCIRMYPDDVAALFPLIPVGTPVRLINEPLKVAWVDGELLLEAHPPVDAEGQSFEPNLDQFSELLQKAVGDSTVAIHWDYAREVLKKADGVLATVGLEADLSGEPPRASTGTPQTQPAPAQPAATAATTPAPKPAAPAPPAPAAPMAEPDAPMPEAPSTAAGAIAEAPAARAPAVLAPATATPAPPAPAPPAPATPAAGTPASTTPAPATPASTTPATGTDPP